MVLLLQDGLTGGLLRIRFNETVLTRVDGMMDSILETLRGSNPRSQEDRVADCYHAHAIDVSRILPTLGSGLYATRNGRPSLGGTLDGFALAKRLKRAKLERQT